MRVALYARVSTADQDPETQLQALREYCRRRENWRVVGEYVERGVSGAKDWRPRLDELLRDAAVKEFDCVLVWKFDRFARSVQHLLESLKHFQSLGIDFVSVTESIDTTTAMGRMVFTFLGAIAEFERALMLERTRAGMDRARAQGKHIGRPRRVVDAEKLRTLLVGPPRLSYRAVAKIAGLPVATVHSAINLPVQKGVG